MTLRSVLAIFELELKIRDLRERGDALAAFIEANDADADQAYELIAEWRALRQAEELTT